MTPVPMHGRGNRRDIIRKVDEFEQRNGQRENGIKGENLNENDDSTIHSIQIFKYR